jgi:3D (Asp-Asp-Asp) domain-containing protein
MNGTGVTATGVDLKSAPHRYIIAVDPNVIPLHTHVHVVPNPFGDDNLVFSAEDTGGAIIGYHIDIYDWRGRASQLNWGRPNVTVTLASASETAPPQTAGGASYFNPLKHANVTAERIDQGVDYAGTGYLVAIADGVITASVANGSGWEGEGYVEYRITQPGFLNGAHVYYAEGVNTVVHVGEQVRGGSRLCDLRQPMPHGIEVGFAAGFGEDSYYRYHDGNYNEGDATRPGVAFSNLIHALGGPAGRIEGPIVGNFPEYMPSGEPPADLLTGIDVSLSAGGNETTPPARLAATFDFPGSLYSAFVQIQRGALNGSHHSHAAEQYADGITYLAKAD